MRLTFYTSSVRLDLRQQNLNANSHTKQGDGGLTTFKSEDHLRDAWNAFGAYTTLENARRHAGVDISKTYSSEDHRCLNSADWRRPTSRDLLSYTVSIALRLIRPTTSISTNSR